MCDVVLSACEEIVEAQYIMALRDQAGTEVSAYETGSACDEDACSFMHDMGLAPRFQTGKLKGAGRGGPGLKEAPNRTELVHQNHPSPWH